MSKAYDIGSVAAALTLGLSGCARSPQPAAGNEILFPPAFVSSNFTLQSSEADVHRAYPRAGIDKRENMTFFQLEPPHESTATAKGYVEYRMEVYFANGKPWGALMWIEFIDKSRKVALAPDEVKRLQDDLLANCASTYGVTTSTESYSRYDSGATQAFDWDKSSYKATLRLFHSKDPGGAIEELGDLMLMYINETPDERKRHPPLSAVGGIE